MEHFLDKKYCNFKTLKIIERERSERQFHKKNYLLNHMISEILPLKFNNNERNLQATSF